jgi:acyl-CoA reductase-like NAD-dependent aldehyde dehydrogenase
LYGRSRPARTTGKWESNTQATSHIRSGAVELPVTRDSTHWIERLWVNGEGDAFARENPASGQIAGRYRIATPGEVNAAVASAKAAFDSDCWSDLPGEDPAMVLQRTARTILVRAEELAAYEMAKSGTPLKQARGD